ncbi:uncharacterized protein LOC141850067 [Brevipalpus obovatus]|uniref:uncharacterized protein LOC141850067 n=1 Tax=Brevipalpus obovatus TaxID=246614 RepID=UPI003D9EAB16
MVFFICGQCNDSLKKVKVEAHLQRCKAPIISCCDCGREFSDESYKKHTICVSENQKYGPQTGDVLSPEVSKGQVKQTVWIDSLKESIKSQASLSEEAERALNKLTELDNVPRKKKKFEKFLINCVRVSSPAIVDEVWKVCEQAIENLKACASVDGNASPIKRPLEKVESEEQVDDTTGPPKKKKQKKSKKPKESEPAKSETVDESEKPLEESDKSNDVDVNVDVEEEGKIPVSTEPANKKQKKSKKGKNNETTAKPEHAEKENDNPPEAVETPAMMDIGGDSDKKANKKRKRSKKSKNQVESNGSGETPQNGSSPADEKPSDSPVSDQPKANDIPVAKSLEAIEKSPKKSKKAKKAKKSLEVK